MARAAGNATAAGNINKTNTRLAVDEVAGDILDEPKVLGLVAPRQQDQPLDANLTELDSALGSLVQSQSEML